MEFKTFHNCNHLITTNPDFLRVKFPILYELCRRGGKYRIQTKLIDRSDINKAVDNFRSFLDKKYGNNDNELLTWSQVLKTLLEPLITNLHSDEIIRYKTELKEAHSQFLITQVDKDNSGIAFVCKKVAKKLIKRFIYGPCKEITGLFTQDPDSIVAVKSRLEEYVKARKIYTKNTDLPKFKLIMKMHKKSWRKAGRPISSEVGSILQRLSKQVSTALNALRPTFQRRWIQILHRNRIYVDNAFCSPPITLDGTNGILQRLRAVNR